jgi:hypothetical protein
LTQVALGHAELEQALTRIGLTDLPGPRRRLGLRRGGNQNGNVTSELLGVLEVLPSGPIPPDPGEFVSSPALAKILSALRERADVVLVDAPGALHVGDVASLSSRADGIVIVARPRALRRRTLIELNRLLALLRTPALGFVATGDEDGDGYAFGSATSYRSGAFETPGQRSARSTLERRTREAPRSPWPMSVTHQPSVPQDLQLQKNCGRRSTSARCRSSIAGDVPAVIRRRGWLVRRMLLAADVLGLVSALLVAQWLAPAVDNADAYSSRLEIFAFLLTVPAWIVITKLYGLYDHDDERANHSTADDFGGVFHMVTVCTWLVFVATYLSDIAHPTAQKLVLFWAAAIAFVCLARAGARALARRNVAYAQNAVIVGAGVVGQLFAKKVLSHPEYGINLVGSSMATRRSAKATLKTWRFSATPRGSRRSSACSMSSV